MHTQVVNPCVCISFKYSSRFDLKRDAAEGSNCCYGENQRQNPFSQSFLSVSSVRPSREISLFIHDSAAVSVAYSIVCSRIILSFNFIRQIGLYKLFLLRMHS